MHTLRLCLAIAFAFVFASCASNEKASVEAPPPASVTQGIDRYMIQRERVEAVSFRLRKAAARDCAKQNATAPELGLIVWSLANFENPDDRAYLQSTFALTGGVTVALAVDGSPAAAAGLKKGDVITRMNGKSVNDGKGATERFITRSNAAAREGPVTLRLSDDKEATLTPETVCKFLTLLVRSPETNAAADGRVLAITSGLFDLTRSDDELALVLGHELAHNVLGHLKKPSPNNPGGILDAFMRATIGTAVAAAKSPPYSVAAEKEADYAGLYFMARAGYDFTAAEAFWHRLNKTTRATSVVKTHPSGAERLRAMRSAIAEIKAKQKANKSIEPNIKARR